MMGPSSGIKRLGLQAERIVTLAQGGAKLIVPVKNETVVVLRFYGNEQQVEYLPGTSA